MKPFKKIQKCKQKPSFIYVNEGFSCPDNYQLCWWIKSFSYEQKGSCDRIEATDNRKIKNHRRVIINDIDSLTHTKYRCQYHIVFAPKYRRQVIYGKYKVEIGKIIREICKRYEVEIIEASLCIDHIHKRYRRNTACLE